MIRLTHSSLTLLRTALCGGALLFTLWSATARAQAPLERYDVIPATWLPGAEDHPAGYVFPSLRPGVATIPCDATRALICSQDFPQFFGPHSRLANRYSYQWTERNGNEIEITVTRGTAPAHDATIAVAPAPLAAILKLSWPEFTQLQRHFRNALCSANSSWIYGNCAHSFHQLDTDLDTFWAAVVFQRAHFEDFAHANLNSATTNDFAVDFKVDNIAGTMHATPVTAGQALNIIWGAMALYPDRNSALSSGYSRPSMGGATQLRIAADAGVTIFPAGTWTTEPLGEDKSQQTTTYNPQNPAQQSPNSVPFPEAWAPLMNEASTLPGPTLHPPVFLPVFGLLDLRDKRLLHSASPEKAPPYLYLLSPAQYMKADAPGDSGTTVSQYASDSRSIAMLHQTEASPLAAPLSLTRRFLLVGCDGPDNTTTHNCVAPQLKALLDQASAKLTVPAPPTPAFPLYTIGVFANQTYLELRNHVSIDGRPSLDTYLTGETWNTVFAAWKPSEAGPANPGTAPLLEVRRTVSKPNFPTTRMRIFFHTTSPAVLGAAQVMEGDEFYAQPNL